MITQRQYYLFVICLCFHGAVIASSPELLLAKTYQAGTVDVQAYWVSEKLDGVRAYWNGNQLISRQGNAFVVPAWFTSGFPSVPLDGELWSGRRQFEHIMSTVQKDSPLQEQWRNMQYHVFELPGANGTFTQRMEKIQALVVASSSPYLHAVKQYRVPDHDTLMRELERMVSLGSEGLMLHHQDALYQTGRSDALLKLKKHYDAEAKVLAHLPGKGKYTGLMGSLLVETSEGQRFKIGSGFSDQDRRDPPAVGSVITYRYNGFTRHGIPRFARFLRVRSSVE